MKPTSLHPPTRTIHGAKTQIILCERLRCGHLWKPHRADPVKCSACFSPLWNKGRVYNIAGADAPTQTPKARGKPFRAGFDERREGDKGELKAAHQSPAKAHRRRSPEQ